jgi:drug/metabolite transporter (DMT)-like permease
MVNYLTAALLGFALNSSALSATDFQGSSWLLLGAITGVLFVVLFNWVALTTQRMGVTVASIATKVSLVIPVVLAVFLYGDTMPALKITGIVVALAAVFLSFYKGPKGIPLKGDGVLALPIVVFIGTGIIDTLIKYAQARHLAASEFGIYISYLFLVASLTGFVWFLAERMIKKRRLDLKSLIAGVFLGIPNYYSIYFLLQTFEHSGMQSSVIFPINNIGIVLVSVIIAVLVYKEKLNGFNMAGILLAVISIGLISIAT